MTDEDRINKRLDGIYDIMMRQEGRLSRIEENLEGHTRPCDPFKSHLAAHEKEARDRPCEPLKTHLAAHEKWGNRAFDLLKQYFPTLAAAVMFVILMMKEKGWL